MTKKDFLKRCENAYNKGLTDPILLKHLERAYDAMHRLEGNQIHYFVDYLLDERERTNNFDNAHQLANDKLGYAVIELLAILTHPCQECAEDPEVWHTRAGFCKHKDKDKKQEVASPSGLCKNCGHGKIRHTAFSGCLGDINSECHCERFQA